MWLGLSGRDGWCYRSHRGAGGDDSGGQEDDNEDDD